VLGEAESRVRGDLLDQLGRHAEAAQEFARAAALAQNEPERVLSAERAEESRARAALEPGVIARGVP
jgi:predicted RNA polymerase sigma factor